MKTFNPEKCAVFCRTKDKFGGLSNFAPKYPIVVNGISIRTTEALYQACRFPDHPEVQQAIIDQTNPLMAKVRSRANHDQTRPDFDDIKIDVMLWCLRLKLIHNWDRFSAELDSTGDLQIVEFSKKDAFWGAQPTKGTDVLFGQNRLGDLLMDVRGLARRKCDVITVTPPEVPNFKLLGKDIEVQHFTEGRILGAA